MSPRTPDQILSEIHQIRTELLRGAAHLEAAELAAERAELAAQLEADKILMQVSGSIPEKQAQARVAAAEDRDAAFVARAAHSRVRTHIRALESALVSLQAELKWSREAGA